ncbi:MAG: DUF4386 domain-containing protein [Candidatus Hermodarchaeota archaeon]
MNNPFEIISQRKAARIAGIGILIRLIVGPFVFFLLDTLFGDSMFVVPGDAAIVAAKKIKVNAWLLCVFIASISTLVMCDVVVVLALFIVLKPVNKDLAMFAVFFRLMGAFIFVISMVFLFIEPLLFTNVFLIGQIIGAFHMLVFGYLIVKSGYIPRILGILLIIGGALGYFMESFTYFFFPDYVWISSPGIIVAVLIEVLLCIWLLWKGNKIPEMKPEVEYIKKNKENRYK